MEGERAEAPGGARRREGEMMKRERGWRERAEAPGRARRGDDEATSQKQKGFKDKRR
jgi:hypothetical protein